LPVFVGNLFRVLVGNVISAEDLERSFHVEISEFELVGLSFRVGIGEPRAEVVSVNLILLLEVNPAKDERISSCRKEL